MAFFMTAFFMTMVQIIPDNLASFKFGNFISFVVESKNRLAVSHFFILVFVHFSLFCSKHKKIDDITRTANISVHKEKQ